MDTSRRRFQPHHAKRPLCRSAEEPFSSFTGSSLQSSHGSLQGIHAVGVLPLHAQVLAAHVTVGSQLAVDGLAQVEVTDDGSGGQVKDLLTACSIFSSETVPVPKVSTMMDTGFATPMA